MKTGNILGAFAIALILFGLIAFYYSNAPQYKYNQIIGQTVFSSDEKEIIPSLETLKDEKQFFIIAEINPENSFFLSEISNSFIIPSVVVLKGLDKNAVILLVKSEGNSKVSCTTNLGDEKKLLDINGQACIDFINDAFSDYSIIKLVAKPADSQIREPFVLAGQSTVEFHPKKEQDLQQMANDFLFNAFPDSREIIAKSNELSKNLNTAPK